MFRIFPFPTTPPILPNDGKISADSPHWKAMSQDERKAYLEGLQDGGPPNRVHDKFIPLSRVGGMACEPECVEAASSVETTHSHDGVGTFLGPEHARLLAAAADHAAAAGFNDP